MKPQAAASAPVGLSLEEGLADLGLIGPALVTVLALFLALAGAPVPDGAATAVLGLQAALMALVAAGSTSSAIVWTDRWTARVAPSRGSRRARARMVRQLVGVGGVGLAGPLALALSAAIGKRLSPADVPAALLSAFLVLAAAQALGAWCGLAWRGHAGRWVMWGWLVLALAIAWLGPLRHALAAWPLVAALGLAGLALAWVAFGRRLGQPRAWRGVPVFLPSAASTQPMREGWQRLPFADTDEAGRTRDLVAGQDFWRLSWVPVLYLPSVVMLQFLLNPQLWAAQAWGVSVQGMGLFSYPGWMMFLTLVAGNGLIHPGLHWRRRLAPGGLQPGGWAWRTLVGSLGAGVAWWTLLVALAVVLRPTDERELMLSTWPVVLGDLALCFAAAAWARGWCNHQVGLLIAMPLMFLAVLALTVSGWALGWPLVRGGGWLLTELLMAALLCVAAVRRWSQRDLNALAADA
jgi:hypothetical protein